VRANGRVSELQREAARGNTTVIATYSSCVCTYMESVYEAADATVMV